ncbi:RNase A-like domain-containing protein [Butyrivibrio sp.]|uniref:RNase A-like domain-containing protein n=1 Tax=Butyrivibrio sp. TaxID=28121 RepID=UPI0025C0DEE4|nr:RNase A-like domain-containing protein [Butyrivibrio sp.]MBQ7430252.1 hypothetical protein [Butyrivibrio sp.]MBQ9303426.1 hypothetical protein [Butyrivibrio sp.]
MLSEYRYMDADLLSQKLEDALYDHLEDTIKSSKGHTEELHISQPDEKLLGRIAKEHKDFSSCFYDKETAEDVILNALVYTEDKIVDWLQKRHSDFADQRNYQQFVVSLDMGGGEPIGRGFNNRLQEIESPAVKIVLQRDFDYDTPFGFYVKSAYVDIAHPHAELTGVEYTREQVLEMDGVTFDSPLEETAFLYQNAFPDTNIRYGIDQNYQEFIKLSFHEDNKLINAFITPTDIKIKELTSGDRVKRLQIKDMPEKFQEQLSVISHTLKLKMKLKEQQQTRLQPSTALEDDLER